jgi:hypothetical protein
MPRIDEFWRFDVTKQFAEDWLENGMDDKDMARLEKVLVHDPHAGDVIPGTGGLRKLRFAREGQGKSGGLRVCYVFIPEHGRVLLTLVYGKTEKKDLTRAEKTYFKFLLEQYRERLDLE